MRRAAKTFVLLHLLLLGSCSSTTFLYNRLDLILPWYLGSYVSLDRRQKRDLDDMLTPFLTWHRYEELPRYLLVIDQVEDALEGEISPAHLAAIGVEFEAAWFRLEAESVAWMLELGEGLSENQMQEFLDKLWEKQADYEEEYLSRSDKEYFDDAYYNLKDSSQDFLGRLDTEQRELLREVVSDLKRSDAIWLRERAGWIEKLATLLAREPGWQQEVLDALAERDETTSAEYVAVYQHNSEVVFSALAQLLNSRTEKQDQRMRRELAKLREDIETLITQRA